MKLEVPAYSNFNDFLTLLYRHISRLPEWGKGNAKSAEKLWAEIQKGDCRVVETEEGGLQRITWPVFINVIYENQGLTYLMYEEKQVFPDGRSRSRILPGSIGEKGIWGENPEESANRGIQEELSTIPLSLLGAKLTQTDQWMEQEEARSYPGLVTESHNSLFVLVPVADQGIPMAFTREEHDVLTFFNWRQIE